eukprot:CAMPEP_0119282608 /NCGR_PEP_ID=MMETSP1329-20130426/27010_1 /TAXON_ID=114041 /ORGANISM="Genus nov. species nov., Strain RCC1024" /LENGTH=389 /DNA_ID=CAMNT_0007283271 /DNA_START=100 /DNA_END=1266 /DNA_ORIENTATION=+
MTKFTLLLAISARAMFDTHEDLDYPETEGTYADFFDSVVIPARDAVKKIDAPVIVGAGNASEIASLQCSADQLTVRILEADRKLVIVGGGPAGLTAAVYAARTDLKPLVIARDGGQLEGTSKVDNYPGFQDGVDAVELLQQLEGQGRRFGMDLKSCSIVGVDLACRPFKVTCEDGEVITSSAVVVATGASPRWLGVPGERELLSRGVHTCATCDGYFYRDKHAVVVGGGDTAMEQALFLARIAKRVTIVHRGSTLRASKAMAARVLRHPKILVLWNTEIRRFVEDPDTEVLGSIEVETIVMDIVSATSLDADGVFVAIGHTPNTQLFEGLRKDDQGYIYTLPGSTVTSVAGVYAAGDVADSVYRQAITSAGTGAMAAMDAERWLCEHGC